MIIYDNLWITLAKRKMKKGDLQALLGISSATIAKMSKNEPVSMVVLDKICNELDCGISDVIEFVKDNKND